MGKTTLTTSAIGGDAEPGYGRLADVFRRNFVEHDEIGAAFCVYRDGRKVVDLWGGERDAEYQLPWQQDTLVPMQSTTKGVATVAIHVAHARGWLDYDEPVATYWPEFAQAGKEGITVRQLLAHQAGLVVVDEPMTLETFRDPDRLADILARQRPQWEPGTRHGYHIVTLGFYESELIRRVDPQCRTIGRFFADEVAARLGIEFYIGLPADVPSDRVARLKGYPVWEVVPNLRHFPPRFVASLFNPRSLMARALYNPRLLADTNNYNRRDVLEVEIASGNGTGQVRGVARLFGDLATGGEGLGLDRETLQELEAPARPPSGGPHDLMLRIDIAWSMGYVRPQATATRRYGDTWFGSPAGRAYATAGAGGSLAFADPDVGVGFAYVPNRHKVRLVGDPRARGLHDALYALL